MIYYNQFNISPERFRIPQYNISPFSTEYVKKNHLIVTENVEVNTRILNTFFGDEHYFFDSGKVALLTALKEYDLKQDDEVYIVTTSGNKYVSSCVTDQIKKICNWNRIVSVKTKLVLVIHEFGMIYDKMKEILELGLPIIEDMAMSMLSNDSYNKVGKYGDYTVFSLPKFFPIQFGGVLKVNKQGFVSPYDTNERIQQDLKKLSSYYLENIQDIKDRREKNYSIFKKELAAIGVEERFQLKENEVPTVFMFKVPTIVDKDGLKIFLQENGVEASVFYGEETFFIPVNQTQDEIDIKFIVSLIKYFIYADK